MGGNERRPRTAPKSHIDKNFDDSTRLATTLTLPGAGQVNTEPGGGTLLLSLRSPLLFSAFADPPMSRGDKARAPQGINGASRRLVARCRNVVSVRGGIRIAAVASEQFLQ